LKRELEAVEVLMPKGWAPPIGYARMKDFQRPGRPED